MGTSGELPRFASPRRFLVEFTVVVAVAAGLLEAVIRLLVVRGVFQRPIRGDARLLWAVPVGYLAVLAVPVVALLVAGRWPESRRSVVAAIALVLAPAIWMLLVLEPNIHQAALAVLALGVALVAARGLTPRAAGLERTLHRAAPVAALAVLALGVGLKASAARAERREYLGLPGGAATPNVVLLIWDTVRSFNLSLYGHARPTSPNLERLARRGVTFEWAFATSPWSLPSHASLLTGLLEQEMIAGHVQRFESDGPTLPAVLAGHGYRTGGFVGNVTYAGREYGVGRGFEHFEDHQFDPDVVLRTPTAVRAHAYFLESIARRALGLGRPEWGRDAAEVNRRFLAWVDERPERPFFAFLNYMDAHSPYDPPAGFEGRIRLPDQELDPKRDSAAYVARLELAYDRAIEYLDQQLGRLLDSLERRGVLDRTVVIVTADHGEQFGEHGVMAHPYSLYRQVLQVPLVILPGRAMDGGISVATPASLRDVPATIMDLLGLGEVSPFPGRSLVPLWVTAPDSVRPYRIVAGETTGEGGHGNAVIAGGRYFIDWPGAAPQLFAFPGDTVQEVDLAPLPAYRAEVQRFMAESDSLHAVVDSVRSPARR